MDNAILLPALALGFLTFYDYITIISQKKHVGKNCLEIKF